MAYATGEWSGPKDQAEAVRWYRLAAEQGHPESMYDLGFMMLLGQGGEKNLEEGLRWVERAGELGEYNAWRLLADLYGTGYCGVPVDADRAQVWRGRAEEYARLNPPRTSRLYTIASSSAAAEVEASLDGAPLLDIVGVTGCAYISDSGGGGELTVYYDPAVITAAELDESIRAAVAGLGVSPVE